VSLITAIFLTPHAASEALANLQSDRGSAVADALLVTPVEHSRRLATSRSDDSTSGGMLDTLFSESVLSRDAIGLAADDVSGHFENLGLGHNLLRELGENIPPGGAALVAAIVDQVPAAVQGALRESIDLNRFGIDAAGSNHLLASNRLPC
jgi:uncharacterized membrane protein